MPQKPNYRFERAERERLQAERKARKEQRKAERRAESERSDDVQPDSLPGKD